MRLKSTIYESTLSTADAVPLPQWGRQIGGGFAEIDDEAVAVLAFVISSATFLAAQDDETGRCSKVVCKSLVMYTALKGFRVQGSGFRVQGSGFRVQRGGAAHKNREAPRSFEIYGIYERWETCEPFEP